MKLIVGITGATGSIFGVRLLEALKRTAVETHLVVSKWGARTLLHETPYTLEQVRKMATAHYSPLDQGAVISAALSTSGWWRGRAACAPSPGIAGGNGDHLVHRAADVILKERRKLVLVVRESPLNEIHLENMLKLARMGVVILPPVPAFYNHPRSLDQMVEHIVMRILDQFDIHLDLTDRWDGEMSTAGKPAPVGSET